MDAWAAPTANNLDPWHQNFSLQSKYKIDFGYPMGFEGILSVTLGPQWRLVGHPNPVPFNNVCIFIPKGPQGPNSSLGPPCGAFSPPNGGGGSDEGELLHTKYITTPLSPYI